MKKNTKKALNKEEVAEDWCFVCKDGGRLLICDYKNCLKAYHPSCVEKDESFLETGNRWTCELHFCVVCRRTPKYQCYCCPVSVCQRCTSSTEFVQIRGKKGFCNDCWRLVLLIEENMDVDSDGERVDFKDRETYEGLFLEYYEIIKEEEGFTTENIHSANTQLKMGDSNKPGSDSSEFDEDEEIEQGSDGDDDDKFNKYKLDSKKKRVKKLGSVTKAKGSGKSNRKEFVGWGSRSLIEFLKSIGKVTSEKLSQDDVTTIIKEYINENKLFQPEKKRKIICDARLRSVFGRKTLNRQRIYDLLEDHFAENQELLEEDEIVHSANDEDERVVVTLKRPRKMTQENNPCEKLTKLKIPENCFASLVFENIKHVYLKRSLIQLLAKQPETFERKVIGSFVRVKPYPSDYSQSKSYHLVQVTGIKKIIDEGSTNILLQVSDIPKDVCIDLLSDDNFSEEECDVLRQKLKSGLLARPTLVDFEQMARNLHEDITKHWIAKELALLQNLIDRANEKGWRAELFQYMERRRILQTSSEQLRLLQDLPTIIPDLSDMHPNTIDNKPAERDSKHADEDLPESHLMKTPDISREVEQCGTFSEEKENLGAAFSVEEKLYINKMSVSELTEHSRVLETEVEPDSIQIDVCKSLSKKKISLESIINVLPPQCHLIGLEDQANIRSKDDTLKSGFFYVRRKQSKCSDIDKIETGVELQDFHLNKQKYGVNIAAGAKKFKHTKR